MLTRREAGLRGSRRGEYLATAHQLAKVARPSRSLSDPLAALIEGGLDHKANLEEGPG